jgi:UDP-glucose 4-epimerase
MPAWTHPTRRGSVKNNDASSRQKALVTGGAGFIGASTVRALLNRGLEVTVLDDLSSGRSDHLEGLDVNLVTADILDRAAVNNAMEGHQLVVHLAAQTGVPGSVEDPYKDCETNVVGTLNVLIAARDNAVSRFVFASSNAPLGRQQPPATEDMAPLPISPYGASKLAGEAYCLAFHGSWGLGTVALRFGNVYGPYSAHKKSVVAKFFKDIRDRGELTIDGDGNQTRDFIFVDDLCQAILRALEGQVAGEVFQISSGRETSIAQLATLVAKVTEQNVTRIKGPERVGDMARNYARVSKAQALLGWEPEVELQDGLRATWEWMQAYG